MLAESENQQEEEAKSRERERPVTELYLQLVWEIRKHIRRQGWTMNKADDRSGLNDGHVAHLLNPETPSGRQGTWESLQTLMEAVFSGGYRLKIKPRRALARNWRIDLRRGAVGRTPIRDFAIAVAHKGAEARWKNTTPEQRSRELSEVRAKGLKNDELYQSKKRKKLARIAALARWKRRGPIKRRPKPKHRHRS